MSKKTKQMPVKYKLQGIGDVGDCLWERSLDMILSPGCYAVEIEHTDTDVGLPFEFCGQEHYIVGTLIVSENGTKGTTQYNRLTGQALVVTLQSCLDTKIYIRSRVNDEWSDWRSFAYTGMYDKISTTDALLSSVEEVVSITKLLQAEFATEVERAKEEEKNLKRTEIQDKKLICKTYTCGDYIGIYCKNNATGEIAKATTSVNGFLIKVSPDEIYRIESTSLYHKSSVPFFSDVPTIDNFTTTYVGYQGYSANLVVAPKDSTYMLVSVNNPSTATAKIELVGWADKAVSNAVATAPKNIGSEYVEGNGNLVAGTVLDMEAFRSLSVNDGSMLEFIAEADGDVEFLILTGNGVAATGKTVYYKSNILHKIALSEAFISALKGGYRWGAYVPANKATISTPVRFRARIINNDSFSYDGKINEQAQQIENINNSVIEANEALDKIAVIPNNNNYLIDWEDGNKAVIRLYVENKELALSNNLYLRQIFRQLNGNIKNCGFNLYEGSTQYKAIAPFLGDFETYEYTDAQYGKVAIRMLWESIKVGGAINCGVRESTNLKDIVFDWEEFVKPLEPTAKVADNSISEDSFDEELKEKINSPVPALSQYELFSLGDSLSSGGTWQTKVSELTGCLFDQSKNVKAGAMLSVGGTSSYGESFDNVLWRAKNLIEQNYITGEGENAIVVLENVNDGYVAFDENVKSIIPTTPIEGYNDADFGTELLSSIADKAQLNAVLRLNKVVAGKNLRIDTLPTKAGNVTLYVGWAGPGRSYYNIYVEPQSTDEETLQFVLDKILEYAYTGITDVLGEDGRSVDFSSGSSSYLPTVEFTDTDNTGMTVTVTDNPSAKGSVARYFIGDSIDEWTDTEKWQQGITYSQGWKSSIEMLQRAYPQLHIFVSMFPMHSVTASEYLLPNGSYDTVAYNSTGRMVNMRKMEVELKKIADFYSLPFLNVFRECGIGINNMLTYYNASANVHPKKEGYYRFGETVAAQIKKYLV